MKNILLFSILSFTFFFTPVCAQTIAGGEGHSLTICNNNIVQAWGNNYYGELGNGTNTDSTIPGQVSALTGITAIAGGDVHSLALKNNGTIWAWGRNMNGQLGNGNSPDK